MAEEEVLCVPACIWGSPPETSAADVHNTHDGDEMRASPGTVLLFYGANLHCRCHRLSGAHQDMWPLQSNVTLLYSVRNESYT